MINIECSCVFSGKNFNPNSLDFIIGENNFVRKDFVGEVATRGRNKGLVKPEGSLYLSSSFEKIILILEGVGDWGEYGIEDVNVCLLVKHDGQCNFELDPKLISRFAKICIPLGITCYEVDKLD